MVAGDSPNGRDTELPLTPVDASVLKSIFEAAGISCGLLGTVAYRIAQCYRELGYTNSLILHEHYFANLGGNGRASGTALDLINRAFGSASANNGMNFVDKKDDASL